ncbi:M23 family metallopeptidase [Nocardioides yefusunii]|uniref:M23 family metallopeptidase n=1 Tax=Nocardioides yefusunii TaxID=2500546 RepID=A0ABW1QV66_9ACTN|nr:peptidoglycan DD-metalloendopeptidase family protein [Nocardioides yefusunii]
MTRPARLRSPVPLALACAVLLGGPPAEAVPERAVGSWPLTGRPTLVEPFRAPDVRWGTGHRGVDLLGVAGQPVHAALSGTVVFAGVVAGVPGVSLQHDDGTRSTYQPVVTTLRVGDVVRRGKQVGTLTPVGSHCAPMLCLHWGLRTGTGRDLVYLDPLTLVAVPRVRLLPLTG